VLDRTLFSSTHYPADDGFVEDTSPRRRPLEQQPREVPAESLFTKASHGTSGDPWRPFGLDPTVPMVL